MVLRLNIGGPHVVIIIVSCRKHNMLTRRAIYFLPALIDLLELPKFGLKLPQLSIHGHRYIISFSVCLILFLVLLYQSLFKLLLVQVLLIRLLISVDLGHRSAPVEVMVES